MRFFGQYSNEVLASYKKYRARGRIINKSGARDFVISGLLLVGYCLLLSPVIHAIVLMIMFGLYFKVLLAYMVPFLLPFIVILAYAAKNILKIPVKPAYIKADNKSHISLTWDIEVSPQCIVYRVIGEDQQLKSAEAIDIRNVRKVIETDSCFHIYMRNNADTSKRALICEKKLLVGGQLCDFSNIFGKKLKNRR